VFHPQIPRDFIARMFATMAQAERHTFQVLTKRPERMARVLNDPTFEELVFSYANPDKLNFESWPLPNVWMGTSIENRHFVYRADFLRRTPAAIRFISAEPLLGPLIPTARSEADWGHLWFDPRGPVVDESRPALDLTDIDWLIVGGESGSGHRKFDPVWAEDLLAEATRRGTTFFMKQTGGPKPGGALEDLPVGLQVREFPRLELYA
jgi:protein gp37